MKWLCKLFPHNYWVSTAEIGFDEGGHYYIAHCKCCGHSKKERYEIFR